MKSRYILFKRNGVYYSEDTETGKQHSLRTKDEAEATTLLHSKNEAHRQPVLNLQIARAYLTASDPDVSKRTWQAPMDEMGKMKTGTTRLRHETAMKDKAFDLIRSLPILETRSAHFLKVLEVGKVSTNVFLRRIHNFALDMNWLPWSILPKRHWPKVKFKDKRAIRAYAIHEKKDAAELVLDGHLLGEHPAEVNLVELLNIAEREFKDAKTMGEDDLEQNWHRLRAALGKLFPRWKELSQINHVDLSRWRRPKLHWSSRNKRRDG